MSTRERSTGRVSSRRRAAASLSLLLLTSGTAVGGAHGLTTVSSQEPGPSTAPSSVSTPTSVAPAVSLSRWDEAVALGQGRAVARPLGSVSAVATDPPPVALGAYHRAAAVLAEAAPSCELEWSLLAAVGQVESGHGKRPESALGADGVAQPAIIGPAIDAPVRGRWLPDTDAGELDGRADQDRAVGPMQLLPGVWAAAGVDGDSDGRRDPQDIDDAALAAGVLLCASAPELSSPAGRRQALRHYNPTRGYVDLVQRLSATYALIEATPPSDVSEDSVRPIRLSARAVSPPVSSATPPGSASTTAAAARVSRPKATTARRVTKTPQPVVDSSPAATAEATPAATAEATPAAIAQTIPETPPPPDEFAAPEAAEPPAAEVTVRTGLWTVTGDGRFLLDGTTVVDVEALGDLSVPATSDLDGDGLNETLGDELAGLEDSSVEVRGNLNQPDVLSLTSLDDLRRVVE